MQLQFMLLQFISALLFIYSLCTDTISNPLNDSYAAAWITNATDISHFLPLLNEKKSLNFILLLR